MQETRIIPYLSALLDEYVKALKKDPLQHWIGEEKVLNGKLKQNSRHGCSAKRIGPLD